MILKQITLKWGHFSLMMLRQLEGFGSTSQQSDATDGPWWMIQGKQSFSCHTAQPDAVRNHQITYSIVGGILCDKVKKRSALLG